MKKYALLIALLGVLTIWTGCKTEDPCEDVTCLNGGTCLEGECQCIAGHEGVSCEINTLQGFLGTYSVDYSGCFTTTENHQIIIDQVDGKIDQIQLYNLGDYACPDADLVVIGDIESSKLTIASQTIDCGPIVYTFEGGGTLSGSTLTLNFKVNYDADGIEKEDNCTAILDK